MTLDDALSAVLNGPQRPPAAYTLAQACSDALEVVRVHNARNTFLSYTQHAQRLCAVFGERPLTSIALADLQRRQCVRLRDTLNIIGRKGERR